MKLSGVPLDAEYQSGESQRRIWPEVINLRQFLHVWTGKKNPQQVSGLSQCTLQSPVANEMHAFSLSDILEIEGPLLQMFLNQKVQNKLLN